jgi:hypothetical protein
MEDVDHQPGTDQARDNRTNQPARHAATDQAFPDQPGDGSKQEQDEQMH